MSDTAEHQELLTTIKLVHGYDFQEYAQASLKRRIASFMAMRKIDSLVTLKERLLEESFFEEFIWQVSVTVTEMFRDPFFFQALRDNAMKRLATYPVIKIWVAGCATGQEAYSIAILLREHGLLDRSIIYATDINQKSLDTAREGIYPMDTMKLYADNYNKSGGKLLFQNYYTEKYGMAMLSKELRQHIVFSPHNLVLDKSFNEFQLIVCRNVLIYFNQKLQDHVINLFYESLCPFGLLGLGNKESLLFTSRKSNFQELVKRERVYMKI